MCPEFFVGGGEEVGVRLELLPSSHGLQRVSESAGVGRRAE